jgi:hypothetical protein
LAEKRDVPWAGWMAAKKVIEWVERTGLQTAARKAAEWGQR